MKKHIVATSDVDSVNNRVRVSVIFYSFIFLVLAVRLFQIQILEHSEFVRRSGSQITSSETLEEERGIIRDRMKREMAISMPVFSLAADPKLIIDPYDVAVSLNSILKIDAMKIFKRITMKDKRFVFIKRKLDPFEYEAVHKLKIQGLQFVREHKRFYPQKETAANVIGFVGLDNLGLEGCEKYFDDNLRASKTELVYFKDSRGIPLGNPRIQSIENFDGYDITLTLDSHLQEYAESSLKETIEKYHAESGFVIMMIPGTGEILVMANYPSYNPNILNESKADERRNRSITGLFEPGSTMKMFIMAIALEHLKTYPDETFYCPGHIEVAGKKIKCHEAHGRLTAREVIQKSCNVGMIKIALKLDPETLYAHLQEFGFGKETQISLPGEANGNLRNPSKWSLLSIPSMAIGQEISVNGLQILTAANSIANKGLWIEPILVREITDRQGKNIFRAKTHWTRRVISRKTAEDVNNMLGLVTKTGGTGVRASLEGFSVAGKTGTAQVSLPGKGYIDKYVSSFMGWFPSDNPEISMLVVIKDPKEYYYGGLIVAPLFKKIAEETINYWNISPELEFVKNNSLRKSADNNTEKLPSQTISLKTATREISDKKSMPQLEGLTMREVMRLFAGSPYKVAFVGTGLATDQRPVAGLNLKGVKTIWVEFKPPSES